jgi:hypothetical protein
MGNMWRACNLTAFIQSHWSSGSTLCFLACGTRVQSPGGYLCETRILLLALSYYIGYLDVIDHCGLVWGGLRPKPSLGRHANYVIIPLYLTSLFCPSFTLAAGPPSGFTTDIVGCWGEPCGEPAIALHSSSLTGPVGQPFASRHEGLRLNPQGGTYVKPGFSWYCCLATNMPMLQCYYNSCTALHLSFVFHTPSTRTT